MTPAFEDLVDFVTSQNGIPREEAEMAVRRCSLAILKGGSVGYTAAGVAAIFFK